MTIKTNVTKRLAAGLLAGLLLLPFASCATENEQDDQGTVATGTVLEEETLDPNYVCDLPESMNFDKTTVSMLYPDNRKDEMISETLGKDGSIADSVYERNLAVESRLNIKLEFVDRGDHVSTANAISTLVRSGDDSIQLFSVGTYVCMDQVLAGCYQDLNRLENVDLTKYYWSQNFNETMTMTTENFQFVAISPMALSMFRLGYLTLFNRTLFAERSIPDLYETVDNGQWTMEYQRKIAADQWFDKDGNGARSEGDFYGFLTDKLIRVDGYAVAADIHLIQRDETGYMVYNSDRLDRFILMTEEASKLYNVEGTYAFANSGVIQKFIKEEGLMGTVMFDELESQIEGLTEITYGIAPLPKLTVEQPDYHTYIQDSVSCFGVSSAISDDKKKEMLGATMEALAYYSYAIVRPAYYDNALSLRFMQDPESRYVLDMMFETFSFDYCYVTGIAGIRDDMREIIPASNPSIASHIKIWEKGIKNQMNKEKRYLDRLLDQFS